MHNIEHEYLKLLKDILDNGVKKEDRTGTGTLSVFGRQIRHKMSEGFPLLTTKKMPFKLVALELLWFLRGDTNIKYLVDNGCNIWNGDAYKAYEKWHDEVAVHSPFNVPTKLTKDELVKAISLDSWHAEKFGDLGPIYGKQWRSWKRPATREEKIENPGVYHVYVDQIYNLIEDLKTNPDSRRLMVNAWNVGETGDMTLPPCHYGFQVWTRELTFDERKALVKPMPNLFTHEDCDTLNLPKRAISLMFNMRSVDSFLGLPFNIASYALLLEFIAKEVNMLPDELIGNLGDAHLYLNHIDQAKEQITRETFKLPTLNFNTEWWDKPFFELVYSDAFCKCLLEEDMQLGGYESHPAIKAPLSN